jgi:RecA-family ATPase
VTNDGDNDAIASGGAEDFDTREAERQSRRNLRQKFQTVGEREWLEKEPPPARSLVELPNGKPWVPREKVGMLAAPGGVGKSQALIQLALCVTCESNRKWLGHYLIPEESRGPVVLAVAEEGERDLWRRIRHATDELDYDGAERKAVRDNLYALPLAGQSAALLDDPGRLERELERRARRRGREPTPAEFERATLGYTDQVEKWRKLLEDPPDADAREWKAIMLDPASRFIGPEAEQDNAVATRFVEILENWALRRYGDQEAGPTVLFSHHVKKSSADDPKALLHHQGAARGSSGLTDGVRWQANMAADTYTESNGETSDVVGLNVVKVNGGPSGEPVFLKRKAHGVLAHDPRGWQKFHDDGDGSTDERFADGGSGDGSNRESWENEVL